MLARVQERLGRALGGCKAIAGAPVSFGILERHMRIGVAYYPEHWPRERWAADAQMMKQMQIDVVRIGEFAWSRLEPRREQFEMDWLVEAVETLGAEGLEVIIGTPTAAAPPWLLNRHPGIAPVDAEGKPWYPGSRRHACLNNRAYQKYARRVVRQLAKTFGRNPHVVAWQIDNELGCGGSGVCYCDDCQLAFRQWLKGRYGSVERLNKKWGTVFWSQEFTDWHEIPAPRRTPAGVHPSLLLDYRRFVSATYRDFVREHADTIREFAGAEQKVTTNTIGLQLDQIDLFSLGVFQDVASVDSYPAQQSALDSVALNLDLTRSVKRKAFWVLEQQAGPTLLGSRRSLPRPGQLRLWSYQAAARGAELISYFRWRTCPFGQEMHWYGMLDTDGVPRRCFDELKRTIAELKGRAALWEGRLPVAKVALVLDYASHWALGRDALAAGLNYVNQLRIFYTELRRMGVTVDFVPPQGQLTDYAAAVVPMPLICDFERAKHLEAYASQGGTLLVTAPAGYRTEENTSLPTSPPADLTGLLGVQVVEHDILRSEHRNALVFEDGRRFPTEGFCSVMELHGAQVLATYAEEFYAGSPAVVTNRSGRGQAFFMGATTSREGCRHVLCTMLDAAGLAPHSWSSESVEIVPVAASDEERHLTFVLNHAPEPVELSLGEASSCEDLLTGKTSSGAVRVEGYGVVLLKM